MKKIKAENFQNFDAYTPFPVHGLDHAQGLKRSPIPYVTFVAGITGTACAFALQYWTSAVDWPINVGGKPFNSWPAFVPVMFEVTILFAGLSTFGALLFFCKLPNLKRKAFDPEITRNKFAIMIEDASEQEATDALKKAGASGIRSVRFEGWF
jgi:hypothetical protein